MEKVLCGVQLTNHGSFMSGPLLCSTVYFVVPEYILQKLDFLLLYLGYIYFGSKVNKKCDMHLPKGKYIDYEV